MPKDISIFYASAEDVAAYLDEMAGKLERVRKVRGYAITSPDASTGRTKVIDIAATDEQSARSISEALLHTPLQIVPFHGVVRGRAKVVRDTGELAMLAAKAQAFLQASHDANTVKPGEPGSDWEGYIGGTDTIEVNKIRKCVRYGENVYVLVARCTQTHRASPGKEGDSITKFDQGLAFAGDVNLSNVALG